MGLYTKLPADFDEFDVIVAGGKTYLQTEFPLESS